MNITDLTMRGLATYRLTRLITRDEITAPLREKVWERFPPTTPLGYAITCDWCTGVWAASALEISRIIAPKTTRTAEVVLATAAVASLLSAHEDR